MNVSTPLELAAGVYENVPFALSASVLGCQVQYVPDVPHWPSPEHTLRLLGGN